MNTHDPDLFHAIVEVIKSRRKAEKIIQRYYRDKITIVWKTMDVHKAANEMEVALTEKEAIQVLLTLHQQHNRQLGLRWEDLTGHIEAHVLGRKLNQRQVRSFVHHDQLTIRR